MDENQFFAWERSSRQTIDFKMTYVDVVGDLMAGLLLSQIVYWFTPDRQGRSKIRIQREGRRWMAKKHSEWYEEIRMTEDQVRRALGMLKKAGLVEVKRFKFAGAPTTHISLNTKELIKAINEIESIEAENDTPSQMELGLNPNGTGLEPKSIRATAQMELGQNPEPYTETTNRDYIQRLHTEEEPPLPPKRGKPDDWLFDEFWSVYPRQESEETARNTWKRIPKRDRQMIIDEVKDRAMRDASWVKQQGKFVPKAKRYLTEKRWKDNWVGKRTGLNNPSDSVTINVSAAPVETVNNAVIPVSPHGSQSDESLLSAIQAEEEKQAKEYWGNAEYTRNY